MSQAPATDRARPRSSSLKSGSSDSPAGRLADLGLIAAFLALTFLLGIFPLKDTDFWWHLKAGDQIRQTGQVPTFDTFTYGAETHRWVDLHWVFQVLLSWGFEHGGVVGLNLAKCAITTLAVAFLIGAKRREWPTWVVLLVWLPALLVLNGRMYIRPETISLLYLAIDLAILFRWDRKPWLAFGLPLVQVCWVNTQGLFLLGPIAIGFAVVDAATKPNAFAKERRGWWRTVGLATALTGLACLVNPYGLTGALYPIQLAGTMSNPIFQDTIAELQPLPKFVSEVGLDSLPLKLHILAFGLGCASFLVPTVWRIGVAIVDRGRTPEPAALLAKGKARRESTRSRKKADALLSATADSWRLSMFRGLLFCAFSVLSLAATRNSHQFAAVVGTVTAWNFAEWAWAIRARRLRIDPTPRPPRSWPRVVTFASIALTFAAVASGRFYAWSGEGRTVGIGEEPLWFPHEAVKFAGGPGMPDRLVGFHNGYPALYEYYWAPARKTYTDARLEVMGPELYQEYLDLEKEIRHDKPEWSKTLEAMGRPAVLIDNLGQLNAPLTATLLKAKHWRCVWFDPIVSLFVHESYAQVIKDHAVDFDARHFQHEAEAAGDDPAALTAMSQALRYVGTQCRDRAGLEQQAQALLRLGVDYARKLRSIDPGRVDGWKQAGLIELIRDVIPTKEPIPRFRMPFDPVLDLAPARATYDLAKALAIGPDDGPSLYFLATLFEMRGMFESAFPLYERYTDQPNRNSDYQKKKAEAADRLVLLQARMGPTPSTKWANLSELDRIVGDLMVSGRSSTLARLMESAHRNPEARPADWVDRLAVLHLHLGEPAEARAAWLAATTGAPTASRLAQIATTYLVEGNFEASRKFYREAIAADPKLFAARYGLASLELDAGNADDAAGQAKVAESLAPGDYARSACRTIFETAFPYARGGSAEPVKPLPSR